MPILTPAPDAVRRPQACALLAPQATPIRAPASAELAPLALAIAAAPTLAALEALCAALWTRWAAGRLDDAPVQALADQAAARRLVLKGQGGPSPARPPLSRARYPSPSPAPQRDRAASRERRRRLAASGVMPPALAARFTTGELAALKIVADEIATRGDCRLSLGEIAARAGISVSTARNALRAAAGEGLVAIEARPRRGLPNLTNIVRLLSKAWRDWLTRGRRAPPQGGGCKISARTDNESYRNSARRGEADERIGVLSGRKRFRPTTSAPPAPNDRRTQALRR